MQVANQESSTLTKLFPILDNKGVNIKKEIMAMSNTSKIKLRGFEKRLIIDDQIPLKNSAIYRSSLNKK